MARKVLLLFAIFLVFGFALTKPAGLYFHYLPFFFAGPAPVSECGEGPGFRYCVSHAPGGTQEDPDSFLYFLHSGSGDEKDWAFIPISRVFYAEFKKKNEKAPTVVSVSYGPYWTLFDKSGGWRTSPVAADFLDRAMPWLEKRLGAPKRRYLWGMSQGGLNSALLLFKRTELWSGAVLSCPALYDFDVYAPKPQIAAYAAGHGLKLERLQYVMNLVLDRISGPEEWRRQDPVALVKGPRGSRLPPVFVDCNRKDEFGLCAGAQAFFQALKGHSRSVEFQENPGGHCAVEPWKPSEFIAGLQASR